MRLVQLLCSVALFLAIDAHAQDLKIIVNKKGKVGFADRSGKEVIKCEYESAHPFCNGTAIVTKSGKSGIIDATGKVLLPLNYTLIQPWGNDLYLIKDGKKAGLANLQGTIVLPVSYSFISKPNCHGKALIAIGGKATNTNDKKTYMANAQYGIINAKGEVLVEARNKGLYEFALDGAGYFPFYEGKRLKHSYHCTVDTLVTDCKFLGFSNTGNTSIDAGIIDEHGNELVKAGLYTAVMLPQSGMVRYYDINKNKTECGYHNLGDGSHMSVATFNGSTSDLRFWSHGDFISDIAPVNGNTWSFIDKQGNQLRTGFSALKHDIPSGLWAAKDASGEWKVFNDKNEDVTALCGFSDFLFPTKDCGKELFCVAKDGKYGCILRDGTTVIPMDYEKATGDTYGAVAIKKNGKWGLLAEDNTELIPAEYVDIIMPVEQDTRHIWVKKADSLYYHINLDTKKVSATGYKSVAAFREGIAMVVPVDMTVDDTQMNRAQVLTGKATAETLAGVDMADAKGHFGYLIGTDDTILAELPVSTLLKDIVIREIHKREGRALTKSETKRILLNETSDKRSYDVKTVLSEDEWDY